jgi:3-hydroxyisobutyrate dehydrogenase
MGLGVCARLADAGFAVGAADIDDAREPAVRAAGAAWLTSTARLASDTDVLVTALPGTDELVHAVAQALPALRRDSTWIDLTSADPTSAAPLVVAARGRGVACLDAPMGGGPPDAAAGTLTLFVGGPAETLAAQRTLLDTLGRVRHVGANGSGYTVKLLVNLLWFGQAVAVGEAMLLAQRVGIEPEHLRSLLADSAADSGFLRNDAVKLLDGDYLETFGLDRCCEELDALVEMARAAGLPFEHGQATRDAYARALEHFGPRDGELLAVALLEQRAGQQLRRHS